MRVPNLLPFMLRANCFALGSCSLALRGAEFVAVRLGNLAYSYLIGDSGHPTPLRVYQ